MPWKSSRFCRKTVVFTRRSRLEPASSRMARRFASTCSVCSSIEPPVSSLSPGFSASCPDTNTSPFALIAWEYGAPWKGAGADSVRTTVLSATCSSFGATGLCECDAERLEDRLENVLRVGPVQEPHVERHACAFCELLEKAAGGGRPQPADSRLGQVDVRDEHRLRRSFEHDACERLGGRHRREAVTHGALAAYEGDDRPPERTSRLCHLGFRGAWLDLEREVEAGIPRKLLE